jgi:hypothetical protein
MLSDISVVLPIKNEEQVLFKNLKNYKKKIENITKKKIIFIAVLNGSTDNSEKIIDKLKKSFQIQKYTLNHGNYGLALKIGLSKVKTKYAIIMNVDYIWDDLFFKWSLKKKSNYDMIIGSKSLNQKLNNQNLYRKTLTGGLNSILKILFNSPVSDTHGLKVINIKKLKKVMNKCKMTRGQFDTEFTLHCLNKKFKIVEVPVKYGEIRPQRNLMIKKIAQNIYDLFFLYLNLKNINLLKKINYSRITREKIKKEI